jgi:hypothetical protein
MLVLDTSILSAMMILRPVREVATWIAAQQEEHLFTTSVSRAEIFSGLAIIADGRRRRDLEAMADAMFDDFAGRVLAFDSDAASLYATLFAARRSAGRPAATFDFMIASIARSHDASVVTRDIGGFEGCGLTLINPWATA